MEAKGRKASSGTFDLSMESSTMWPMAAYGQLKIRWISGFRQYDPTVLSSTYDDTNNYFKTSFAPELSEIAIRLYNTTANSVASERSFSSMNFIHSKTRNQLQSESVDKLVYIQMNHRYIRDTVSSGDTEQKTSLIEDIEQEEERMDLFDIKQIQRRYFMDQTTQLNIEPSDREKIDEASQIDGQLVPRGTKRAREEE
jgi:hAT family protein